MSIVLHTVAPTYLSDMSHTRQNTRYSLRSYSPHCICLALTRFRSKRFGVNVFLCTDPGYKMSSDNFVKFSSTLSMLKKNLKMYSFTHAFKESFYLSKTFCKLESFHLCLHFRNVIALYHC